MHAFPTSWSKALSDILKNARSDRIVSAHVVETAMAMQACVPSALEMFTAISLGWKQNAGNVWQPLSKRNHDAKKLLHLSTLPALVWAFSMRYFGPDHTNTLVASNGNPCRQCYIAHRKQSREALILLWISYNTTQKSMCFLIPL